MQILEDSVTTKVLHTRVIRLHDAPKLKTNKYYGPKDEQYRPWKLTVKWYEGDEPKTVDVEGTTDGGEAWKTSFGKGSIAIPDWLTEIAFPETKQQFVIARMKIKVGSYDLLDKITGKKIAEAHLTGRYGADNYPWDWYLADGLTFGGDAKPNTGACDALHACIDIIQSRANQYGVDGL